MVQDMHIDDAHVNEVEEHPFPPLQGAMGIAVVQDHLVTSEKIEMCITVHT